MSKNHSQLCYCYEFQHYCDYLQTTALWCFLCFFYNLTVLLNFEMLGIDFILRTFKSINNYFIYTPLFCYQELSFINQSSYYCNCEFITEFSICSSRIKISCITPVFKKPGCDVSDLIIGLFLTLYFWQWSWNVLWLISYTISWH